MGDPQLTDKFTVFPNITDKSMIQPSVETPNNIATVISSNDTFLFKNKYWIIGTSILVIILIILVIWVVYNPQHKEKKIHTEFQKLPDKNQSHIHNTLIESNHNQPIKPSQFSKEDISEDELKSIMHEGLNEEMTFEKRKKPKRKKNNNVRTHITELNDITSDNLITEETTTSNINDLCDDNELTLNL